ncbi:MAG: anti-sigma-K factor RskA [Cyclobacteriaceae bacterium]
MDTREIIEGGYLEALLTGDLDDSTKQEIEERLAVDIELRSAYYTIEKKIELLAFRYSIEPNTQVKQRLMENPTIMNAHLPDDNPQVSSFSWLSIAASIVTVGSMILSIYFWNQWQDSNQEITTLLAEKTILANNFKQTNQQLDDVRSDIAVLVNPAFSRLILKGTDNAPNVEAVIYWNKEQEAVLINSASLSKLNENQQYQLWALLDGKPIDAGVFDAQSGIFQSMKNIASADAFAVTIEPIGGSKAPTLSTMQVYVSTS